MVTPLNGAKVGMLRTRTRIYDLLITSSGVFCDVDSEKLGKSPNVWNKDDVIAACTHYHQHVLP